MQACRTCRWGESAGLVIALAVAAAAAPALAQDVPEAQELGDIVVTASGHDQQLENAPASISVIDRDTLEQRQFNDVTDALRSVSGVTITGGGAGDNGADISMRGLGGQYTLLLVDGQRIDTRETRPNGSSGFEQHWLPPLQAIERIEVIRGPMSTLYGSDAMGGVVNVITRKVPEQWQGSVQLQQVIQADRDSGDSHKSDVYIGGPISAGLLGVEIFGGYSARAEDEIIDGYEERTFENLTTRFTLTPHAAHDLTFEAGVSKQNRQETVGKTLDPGPTACPGDVPCKDSDETYTNQHYSLGHTGRLAIGTIETHVKREVAENRSRDMEVTNTNAKTSLVVPLGDHIVTLGGSYKREELYDATSNTDFDRTEVDASRYAAFVEDEWLLAPTLSLTGGVRVDDDENYGSHASPRLYAVWNTTPNWTLKGGVSTGYRAPGLRAITPDWSQVSRGGNVYGNPDLEPETSVNKEASLLYDSGAGLQSSLTVFHNRFEDKINRVACAASTCPYGPNQFGSDPTYRVNVDEAITEGVEASLNTQFTRALAFSASYTYIDSEQKTGENKGEPLNELPEDEATVALEWQATPRLTPWTRVTYRGEERKPVTGPSQRSILAPDYTFVDVGVGYRLNDSARINAAVYNAADEEITYEEYGYIEDGRRLWVSLTANF